MMEYVRFESEKMIGIIVKGNGRNSLLLNATNTMTEEEKIKMLQAQLSGMEILDSVVVFADGTLKVPANAEI